MLHHQNVTPKMARMPTFIFIFYYNATSHQGTSNVVADALSRSSVDIPAEEKRNNYVSRRNDGSLLCAHRNEHLRRHVLIWRPSACCHYLTRTFLSMCRTLPGSKRCTRVGWLKGSSDRSRSISALRVYHFKYASVVGIEEGIYSAYNIDINL